MIILAHRGWHRTRGEQNGMVAFARAMKAGFGIETDIRDRNGTLAVAHDLPARGALPLAALLASYKGKAGAMPLALNIKSDGLAPLLMPLLKRSRIRNYFVFDMSGPEMLHYLAAGANVFTRQSEHEPEPACYGKAAGVWLDEFETPWITEKTIARHIRAGKQLCFVSPELHGRAHTTRWKFYRSMQEKYPRAPLMLCTDYPEKAAAYFHD